VRSIRITIISMITVGLVAGSAVGAMAQSALVTGEFTEAGAEFSDERLTGDVEVTSSNVILPSDGDGFTDGMIATEDIRLTNDEGSWSGQSIFASFAPTGVPEGYASELPEQYQWVESGDHLVLIGEDGYEGLMAYLTSGPTGTWGIILEAEPME
jgi:hypothetical protein